MFHLGIEIRLVFYKYSLVGLILSLVVAFTEGERTAITHIRILKGIVHILLREQKIVSSSFLVLIHFLFWFTKGAQLGEMSWGRG